MDLDVQRAAPADLIEAERLMRTVLAQDLGGYRPQWHADLDDLAGHYLGGPRAVTPSGRVRVRTPTTEQVLFVARLDGAMAGTAAVRSCRLRVPPNPQWLAERYNAPDVAQLVRVWVARGARRHGAARALVTAAARWAVTDGGYRVVYLHTDASVPGAEAFWRAMPTTEIHDARPDEFNTVHFELDVAKLPAR